MNHERHYALLRRCTEALFIGALALAFTACSADAGSTGEPSAVPGTKELAASYVHLHGSQDAKTTICSERMLPLPNGDVQKVLEQYDFDLINREALANPVVAARARVTQVATCDDARSYMKAYAEVMESAEPEEETVASVDDIATAAEALKGGTLISSERGIAKISVVVSGVRQHICSAFLFSSRVLVTAAHCFGAKSGVATADIHYFDPDTGGQRLIATQGVDLISFFQHPDWKGGTDTPNDVGIIVRGDAWPGTDSIDYLPILWGSPGVVRSIDAFGSGFESFDGDTIGRLRTANWGINSNQNNQYLITRPESSRMCRGDSGGAGTFFMSGGRTAVTVNSNGDFSSSSDHCVCKGCKARHAVVTPLIVNWIRGTVPMNCVWTTDWNLQQSFVNCF